MGSRMKSGFQISYPELIFNSIVIDIAGYTVERIVMMFAGKISMHRRGWST